MIIRPITTQDLEDLYALSKNAGIGVTTLPADKNLLAQKIQHSLASFSKDKTVNNALYFFALEDPSENKIVGVSAIESAVGTDDVWYNYRLDKSVNASRELGIHTVNTTLYLSNDLTGCSEICTLFLDPEYRRDNNGRLLSKSRFLFMREFTHLFADKVIAEMRGYSDAEGYSPFWESLGRKFFQMDFSRADYLSAEGNKSFLAELMPKYPICLAFLDSAAQQVVGQVHENTRPALEMLKSEGFNFNGFVDIFDAGPIVECFVSNVRAVRESRIRQARICQALSEHANVSQWHLVSNCKFSEFRSILVPSTQVDSETLALSQSQASDLLVEMGDPVRIIPLRYAN